MIEIQTGSGNHRFMKQLEMLGVAIRRGVNDGWRRIGQDLVDDLREQTLHPKTGRVYRLKGRLHRASAAGETPARVSGAYARSASYIPQASQLTFGVSVPYGGYLEEGTSRMDARPGLQNSIEEKQDSFPQTMEEAIRRTLD